MIILTADRTLVANYDVLLDGILGTINTTSVSKYIYNTFLSPEAYLDKNNQLVKPPYGLRKLESALISNGFSENDIAFVHPNALPYFDKDCKIICISSGDPLGMGMISTTMKGIMGGEPYTKLYFQEVVRNANYLKIKKKEMLKLKYVVAVLGCGNLLKREI